MPYIGISPLMFVNIYLNVIDTCKGKKDSELVPNLYGMFIPSDFKKHFAGWIFGSSFSESFMEKWQDSGFGRLSDEVPEFRENLQYFGDAYSDLVKPFLTTKRLKNSDLFQNITFVHGDFHLGNLCFPDDHTAMLYDWQCYGYGHGATEISHLLSSGVLFDPENDRELLQAYYSELTSDFGKGVLVDAAKYPFFVFEREITLRFLSYATVFTSMLSFSGPEEMEAMWAKKGTSMNWDNMLVNMFKRVFHILRNPERDVRSFILGK
jgi:hypothetical protein